MTRPNGAPLGLPVIHFANASRRPRIVRAERHQNAPGYQDRMTDTQNSIQVSERLTGYQMYWSKGFKWVDKEGNAVQPKAAGGVALHRTGRMARSGATGGVIR